MNKGVTERNRPDRLRETMITQTGIRPHFRCNDVVLTLGVGGNHLEMVDDLRRAAWARWAEQRRNRIGSWLRLATD